MRLWPGHSPRPPGYQQRQRQRTGVSVPHGQNQHRRQERRCGRSWFPPFAKGAKDGAPSFVFADAKSNAALRLGVHVGAEDGVDAGLVAGVLAEPAEEVGVEADGDDFFGHRHDDPGVFPEGFVGGVGVGIGGDALAYLGIGQAAQLVPVGGGVGGSCPFRSRGFASSGGARAARSARLR